MAITRPMPFTIPQLRQMLDDAIARENKTKSARLQVLDKQIEELLIKFDTATDERNAIEAEIGLTSPSEQHPSVPIAHTYPAKPDPRWAVDYIPASDILSRPRTCRRSKAEMEETLQAAIENPVCYPDGSIHLSRTCIHYRIGTKAFKKALGIE